MGDSQPPVDEFQRLIERDDDAWRALHEREFPLLFRFAVGMGADPDLAEDCASEAFIRLVSALPRLRIDSLSAIRAWLVVTCRNHLRDQFRKRRGQPVPIEAVEAASPDVDALTRVALTSALASLPDTQREVLVMRFVLGMPAREVAVASGRGLKAVESLQHRALEALRRSPAIRMEDS